MGFVPIVPIEVHNDLIASPAPTTPPADRSIDIPPPPQLFVLATAAMADDHSAVNEMGDILIKRPPPAYGRWRGSVRADPDLLHWLPVSRNTDDDTNSGEPPAYISQVGHMHADARMEVFGEDDYGNMPFSTPTADLKPDGQCVEWVQEMVEIRGTTGQPAL